MSEQHICPKCQSPEASWIGFSCPTQAKCAKCNHRYSYGPGIRVLGLAEGIALRPQLYQQHLCSKCFKYKLDTSHIKELSEEDVNMLCTCKKD